MTSPIYTEFDQKQVQRPILAINAWTAQNIVYELVTDYFYYNTAESLGIPLKYKYNKDKTKSDIFIDIAYNYNGKIVNQRPAIFIGRQDVQLKGLTMGHKVGATDIAESEYSKLIMNQTNVTLSVIAAPILTVELLAEYAKSAILYFQQEIQNDFKFRRFRLSQISKPQIYVESQDNFVIMINIEVVYDEGWVIKGDDLRLKTVSKTIFDSLTSVSNL